MREITTTVIAWTVLAVTMTLLCLLYAATEDPKFEEKKDIVLYALPILGSIIGYYFGRVPAERRAEAAEQGQNEARNSAQRANESAGAARREAEITRQQKQEADAKVERTKGTLERVKPILRAAAPAQRRTLGGSGEAPTASEEAMMAYAELEALSRTL